MAHLSAFATRVLKDVFTSKIKTNSGKYYTVSEQLEIVKMFDELGTWPKNLEASDLFNPQNLDHLAYFVKHHPDLIEVVQFIREDPYNYEATQLLIPLAIQQMNDPSNPDLQQLHISDYELLGEVYHLTDLIEATILAKTKYQDSFDQLKAQRQAWENKEQADASKYVIQEARNLLKDPLTAWKARNLVGPYLRDLNEIGDQARHIAKLADQFDGLDNKTRS